jgi:hypothetical protein
VPPFVIGRIPKVARSTEIVPSVAYVIREIHVGSFTVLSEIELESYVVEAVYPNNIHTLFVNTYSLS